MVTKEKYQIEDLPKAVMEAVAREIADYSIGFLRVKSPPRESDDVTLLGSGTLVSVGTTHAILTAHHVLSVLPRSGRLGLILSRTASQETIDTQGLAFVPIARGTVNAEGPDLGAVILAPPIASAIGTKKSFYNLECHRDHLLHSPPDVSEGFWVVYGFVGERTVEERDKDGYDLVKGFYNLSGVGQPEQTIVNGDHDYFDFLVSYEGTSIAPRSFGGMSGGGLWQVPLIRDDQGQIKSETPLLSGVVFYQKPTTETNCGVKCHGRASVYRVAFEAIREKQL